MRTAVVTIVSRRHEHLRRQYAGLAAARPPADAHVVVAMADPAVAGVAGRGRTTTVLDLPAGRHGLPLAAARNAGAARAAADGAELLVFLDVDCLPEPGLVAAYAEVSQRPEHAGHLLAGPVHYLPPPGPGGYDPLDPAALAASAAPHPARPAPPPGEVLTGTDPTLFWSLNFAVRTEVWARIGGFCADYEGYGGEDTDFALSAAAAGVGLRWVGGAAAYHQHHPVSRPPVEHLDDILRNGSLFRRRWGRWPMGGWLTAFAERGLVEYDVATGDWRRSPVGSGGRPYDRVR